MRRIALVSHHHPAVSERLLAGAVSARRPDGGAFVRMFDQADYGLAAATALAWKPDGILANLPPDGLESLVTSGLPVVALTEDPCNAAASAVISDESAIGEAAAQHLLGRGYRNLGFLAQGRGGQERESGWRRCLAASGLDSASIRLPGIGDDAGRLRSWLQAQPLPLGLFCYNDIMGLEAVEACHALGLAVPAQVAVVGADDLTLALGCDPPLSSVRVQHEAIGRRAAALLYALLDGSRSASRIRLPPGGLAVRASSDASAIDDEVAAAALALISHEARRLHGISALAKRLGIPRRTLERRFRAAVGRSPLEELQRTRVELARQALSHGRTVASAADLAGFRSVSALQRAFASQVGLSPAEYARSYALA